ncbi:MAG: dephospho-CoA kinase [Chlorobium sp.]
MQNYPFLVGVTGGLGSGKSMVCHFLADLGCALFESDRVAKELQLRDTEVIAGIKKLFGADVYSFDGDGGMLLDRKKIAEFVFASPDKLQELNRLVHPRVFDAFCKAVQDAKRVGTKILVKEAAILFESGGNRGVDAVVVVVAEMQERIMRAVQKGMGSPEEIKRRILTQWPQEKLISRADYLLFNTGSLDDLKKETEKLFHKLLVSASAASCNP